MDCVDPEPVGMHSLQHCPGLLTALAVHTNQALSFQVFLTLGGLVLKQQLHTFPREMCSNTHSPQTGHQQTKEIIPSKSSLVKE